MLRGDLCDPVDELLDQLREEKGSGSDVEAVCFDTEGFPQSFRDFYRIPLKKQNWQKSEFSFFQTLEFWYDEPQKREALISGLRELFGEEKQIYTDEEGKMKERIEKASPFFFLFDYFAVEYEKTTLVFTLGSND